MKIFALLFLLSSLIFAQDNSGREAPDFLLENLEGDEIVLSEEIGEGPVILSFWATWCKPCLEELSHFNEFYKSYKDDGLKIFAIATDDERSVAKVKPFASTQGFDFPVLYDTNSDVARSYYARMVPYTVIISTEGNIVYNHMGYKKGDEEKVKKIIEDLITK